MVKPKHDMLDEAIKVTKMRIKHCEKNGMGKNVMEEKNILKKQERKKELQIR